MNYKTTIILLVLLIVVGAAVFFATRHPAPEETSITEKKLLSLDPADITKISIAGPDEKHLVLSKTGVTWRLEEPVQAPAQTFAAEDLARAFTDLKSRGEVGSEVQTGVDQPRYKVELTDKTGKTQKLFVGLHQEVADHLYVKLNDQPKAQVVDAELETWLTKPLNDYRQARLTEASTTDIRRIMIAHSLITTASGDKMVLIKDGDKWTMTEPSAMPLDSSEMNSLVNTLSSLRAVEFIDKPQPLASYQLADPRLTVTFSARVATTQPATNPATHDITVHFGRYDDILKKNIYAQISDHAEIVKVTASTFDTLNKSPLDLRDRAVVDIDPAKVTRVVLHQDITAATQPTTRAASSAELVIERTKLPTTNTSTKPTNASALTPELLGPQPAKWKLVKGQGAADDNHMTVLLNSLHPLRVEKYHAKAPTSQPAESYRLEITTDAPAPIKIQLSEVPGLSSPQGAATNLSFDADRSVIDTVHDIFNPAPPAARDAIPELPR